MLTNDLPWVTFILAGQKYAVNSQSVVTIEQLPPNITKVSHSSSYIRGIAEFRGGVIPLADMRVLFDIKSSQEEYADFVKMLEQRKQDHINWVENLKRSVKEDSPFTLTTDPHKCAFGKWYDNYAPASTSVKHLLLKIDAPHKALHGCAAEVKACTKDCTNCTRGECLKKPLDRAMGEYMPLIVGLLEDAKQVFREEFKEMILILQHDEKLVGLIVDEVSGVEELTFMLDNDHVCENPTEKELVSCVAKRKNDNALTLVLDGNSTVKLIEKNSDVSFILN